jgi:hypothetical protein
LEFIKAKHHSSLKQKDPKQQYMKPFTFYTVLVFVCTLAITQVWAAPVENQDVANTQEKIVAQAGESPPFSWSSLSSLPDCCTETLKAMWNFLAQQQSHKMKRSNRGASLV